MPALDERIASGAKQLAFEMGFDWEAMDDAVRYQLVTNATFVLRAAFPELFQSPPTHWLAPWEATEKMIEAAAEHDGHTVYDQPADGETHYTAMRTSYLSEKT